jgi:hypothetical protein
VRHWPLVSDFSHTTIIGMGTSKDIAAIAQSKGNVKEDRANLIELYFNLHSKCQPHFKSVLHVPHLEGITNHGIGSFFLFPAKYRDFPADHIKSRYSADLYGRIIRSRLFKFIVGEAVDGAPSEFSVHEVAIAQLSEPLRNLTQSGPQARAGLATWKDVGKDTFERFVQYAYTGDYSIPKTQKRSEANPLKVNGIHPKNTNGAEQSEKPENGVAAQPSSPGASNNFDGVRGRVDSYASDETPSIEVRDGSISEKLDDDGTILNYPSMPTKKHKKKKKAAIEKAEKEAALKAGKEIQPEPELKTAGPQQPEPEQTQQTEPQPPEPEGELISLAEPEKPSSEQHLLTEDFYTLSYPLLAPRDNYEGTCEPSMDFEKAHNYSNVLLSHASLYVLGDAQLIENLKALALFKLHKTLCAFELDTENIGDITDLAKYAYSADDKGADEGSAGLRGLVCQYMAIHAKELSTDAKFMNLLVGGGQIVQDFIKLQLQRTG